MPPTRLPTPSDFPALLNPIFHPTPSPSPGAPQTLPNILLFLPGLGDTSPNFSAFPRALNLPDTLAVTLQPPFPLPFGVTDTPAYHWSDDLSVSTTGGPEATESGFVRASKLVVEDVVVGILIRECGYRGEEIHVFGFGQGGSLALVLPLCTALGGRALGSVVSVGGPLPVDMPGQAREREGRGGRKNGTSVLVLGGKSGEVFGGGDGGESRIKRMRERYEAVEVERWRRGSDGMPKNREEVLPLMRLWGRRLRSQRGVPAGAVEVG